MRHAKSGCRSRSPPRQRRSTAWPRRTVSAARTAPRSISSSRRHRMKRRCRSDVSWPGGLGRQRHQDRLDIAAGLEAEPCAAVVKQVEFDVTAAADELVATLFRGPRAVHPRPHDRRKDREKRLADRPAKGEIALPVATVEIVDKDPAGAAWLAALRPIEILVPPGLGAGVAVGIIVGAAACQGS